MIIALILLAIISAELVGGLFHWWEDRYGNPDWPILGKMIIQPNIEHHRNPSGMCQQTYWFRNRDTIFVCLIGALFFHSLPALVFWALLSQMNEFHNWTHKKSCPYVRFFQQWGILQSPKHHKIHHEKPFDKNYCVMTNYMNPLLAKLKFWDRLEWLIHIILGVSPRAERCVL